MKIWRSKSGLMYYSENAEGLESYASDRGTWVSGDGLPGDAVLVYDSDAQPGKVEVDPEDARIDKALAVIRERHSLCHYFDDAVDRAKNLSLLDRLEFVAFEEGRMDLHTELVKELNKPAYEPPTVPENGDYVTVTYLNGIEVAGVVRRVGMYTGFTGFWVGDFARWTIIPEPGSRFIEREPHNVAATIEVVKQPVEPVEIDGYWIVRGEDTSVVAYLSEKDAAEEGGGYSTAESISSACEKIAFYSSRPAMREYIPALLAIVKFFEQEKEAV